MKQHLLSTGANILPEARPFDPLRRLGLRGDDPEAEYLSNEAGAVF